MKKKNVNAFNQDRKKALECGMDGFLSKPIVIEELISALQNNLESFGEKNNVQKQEKVSHIMCSCICVFWNVDDVVNTRSGC